MKITKDLIVVVDSDLDQYQLLKSNRIKTIILDASLHRNIETIYENLRNVVYYINNNNLYFDKEIELYSRYTVIGIQRMSEISNLKKIEKLNIFEFPKTYSPVNTSIPANTRLILKVNYQARSMGKHIFKDIYELLEFKIDCKLHDMTYVYDKYNVDPGKLHSDDEKNTLYDGVRCNSFHIQEVVPFTTEFRILYFKEAKHTDFIIEERIGYQPNSEETRQHTLIKMNKYPILNEILLKCKELGDSINALAISIDIYYDSKTDKYGIFEYSPQFGVEYDRATLAKISKMYTKALEATIEEF